MRKIKAVSSDITLVGLLSLCCFLSRFISVNVLSELFGSDSVAFAIMSEFVDFICVTSGILLVPAITMLILKLLYADSPAVMHYLNSISIVGSQEQETSNENGER